MRPIHLFVMLGGLFLVALGGCGSNTHESGSSHTVSALNLNLLHGFDCDPPVPGDGDQCRLAERVGLLGQYLVAQQCPDIVTLQEIVNRDYVQRSPTESAGPLDSALELLRSEVESLAAYCGFTYELVYRPFLDAAVAETDEEVILSRYPVLHAQLQLLHSALYDEPGGFRIFARHLLFARLDHPAGPVDVYTTHLSSGADDATNPCNSSSEFAPGVGPRVPCPAACNADDTVRVCQARQLALFVEQSRLPSALVLVSGDFNARPGSAEYLEMTGRGWLDTHLAAGSAECDAQSGLGCTSGRDAEDGDLEEPGRNVKKRIDYIFADPPPNCELDSAGVLDVAPNPFVASCGSEPAAICWMSDHSANSVRFTCR